MIHAAWQSLDLTPPVGDIMVAFPTKDGPRRAEAIRDPIMAQVLVLSTAESTIAWITIDWCGIRRSTLQALRAAVAERVAGTPPTVLVACSHTHSGPETLFLFGGSPDADYLRRSIDRLADTIVDLQQRQQPVACSLARRDLPLNHNRRVPGQEHRLALTYEAGVTTGPVDHRLTLLELRTQGDRTCWLWHYTGHPLTLGPANRAFSADFPGDVRRQLQTPTRDLGFLQGAAANIHLHDCMRADDSALLAMSQQIADALTSLADDLSPLPDTPISFSHSDLHFPNRIDPSLTVDVEVSCLRLAGCPILFVPGEYFVEFQLALRDVDDHAILVSYANDWPGYIPHAAAYTTGGYGVDAHTTDPAPLSRTALPRGAGEAIYDTLLGHATTHL